jgi:arabinoxylan arabinofuranohydrolase
MMDSEHTVGDRTRDAAAPGIFAPTWQSCLAAAVLLIQFAGAQKLITPGYLFNSDPTCREIDGQFYLFTTQDPFTVQLQTDNRYFKGMYAYHALSTTDFDHWVDHGSILTSRDVAWSSGAALWDGDAGIPANGKFYAYAPFRMNSNKEANYGTYNVGVFSANTAAGHYRDLLGGPMRDVNGKPLEALSPLLVKDDDGSAFLLWGSGDTTKHEVLIARLQGNMTQLAEQPRKLAVPEKDLCGNLEYFESPVLFHHGSKWYLSFVAYKDDRGNACDSKGSYVDYTIADHMFGPFDGPVRHLIYPSAGGEESVQQGICQYRGDWYLAYHLPYDNLTPYADHHRQVAVTSLRFNPDGTLIAVNPDRDTGVGTPGVSTLRLDAFATRREAAEFHVRTKAIAEPGLSGEYQLKMKDGGYLQFHDVDFANGGARTFHAEVSSEVTTLRNGTLEVRLDHPAGKLIASIPVDATGGNAAYRTLSGKMQTVVVGVHDVCLVARGEGASAQGYLFNITWFNFAE